MSRMIASFIVVGVLTAGPATAQAPGPAEADPGVRPTRLIDREEVRVTQVDLAAGATRRPHAHADVEYHLWVPVQGTLQLTIGADPPIAAASGQAFFLKRATSHGFKNVGTTPAVVLEIFVKRSRLTSAGDVSNALAIALAQSGAIQERR